MVRDREGCRERIGVRPVPSRMIAATVAVSVISRQLVTLSTLINSFSGYTPKALYRFILVYSRDKKDMG